MGLLSKRLEKDTYTELNKHIQEVADSLDIPVKWGGTFKTASGKPWFDGHHWQLEVNQ